jgi:hypothetical protein
MTPREHWEYTKQHPMTGLLAIPNPLRGRCIIFLFIGGCIGHLVAGLLAGY